MLLYQIQKVVVKGLVNEIVKPSASQKSVAVEKYRNIKILTCYVILNTTTVCYVAITNK